MGAPVGRRQPRFEEDITCAPGTSSAAGSDRIVFRGSRESDLNEELQLHLERETERLQASGLSREDARLQARRLFGGVEQIKEASRDARGTGALDALARDTRHGLRRLVRDWRFTTAAVLILGLAIGANTAIFSVVNAALFRDKGFADPDRLVDIYQNDPAGKPLIVISYDIYKAMAEYTDIFAATMAATIPVPNRYLHEGGIRSGTAEYATATYLDVLGLRPSLGRWFDATEERPGAPLVAVLGHQAWTRVFRADPSVIGRVVRIEGVPVTIVGIGPANHRGTVDVGLVTDFWLPITALASAEPRAMRGSSPPRSRTLVRESPPAGGRHRGAGQSGDGRARTPARGRVSGSVSRRGRVRPGHRHHGRSHDGRADPPAGGRAVHGDRLAGARHRQPRPRHRVQQPGHAAAGTRRRAGEGSLGAAGHGRQATSARAAPAD